MHQTHLKHIYSSCFFHVTCKPHTVSLAVASHLIFFSLPPLLHFPFLLSSCFSVDLGCFAIITGVRKRIEASNSVVYAVITRGIYLCLSQCTSREKNKQNSTDFIGCGENLSLMHPGLRLLTLHVLPCWIYSWCSLTSLQVSKIPLSRLNIVLMTHTNQSFPIMSWFTNPHLVPFVFNGRNSFWKTENIPFLSELFFWNSDVSSHNAEFNKFAGSYFIFKEFTFFCPIAASPSLPIDSCISNVSHLQKIQNQWAVHMSPMMRKKWRRASPQRSTSGHLPRRPSSLWKMRESVPSSGGRSGSVNGPNSCVSFENIVSWYVTSLLMAVTPISHP